MDLCLGDRNEPEKANAGVDFRLQHKKQLNTAKVTSSIRGTSYHIRMESESEAQTYYAWIKASHFIVDEVFLTTAKLATFKKSWRTQEADTKVANKMTILKKAVF